MKLKVWLFILLTAIAGLAALTVACSGDDDDNDNNDNSDPWADYPATLSGTLYYDGDAVTAKSKVMIAINDVWPMTAAPLYYVYIDIPETGFPFEFKAGVDRTGVYYVLAIIDVDPEDRVGMTPDLDPMAIPTAATTIVAGDNPGIDLTFLDPDELGDDDDNDNDNDDTVEAQTWTDPDTGLTWAIARSTDRVAFDNAGTYCVGLEVEGGGWRLPTISELRSLIVGCDKTVTGGACTVTDSCLNPTDCWNDPCWGCDLEVGPNNGCYGNENLPGECDYYWSSSSTIEGDSYWLVNFDSGKVDSAAPDNTTIFYARCVR